MLDKLISLDLTSRLMFGEVVKLVTLIVSLPATVASAERSFSMLRRLKTYLRSRTGQKRLTNLALLNVYPGKVTQDAARELARQFVEKNAERKATFGKL